MKVTIGIKTLNEEARIAAAIRSALAAVERVGGDVVVADSGSADATVAIAKKFPVRIVQLANPTERCCGAGAQLAYQQNRGEYFYLLDGDMVLDPDFLPAAIKYLEENPKFAAVGGRVREVNTSALEFQIRAQKVQTARNWLPGTVDRLDCGGLYRRSALHEIGYFADRNLHAFEEYDLGVRLRERGWLLARIDRHSIDHFGHATEGYALLWRRIRSGHSSAAGEVVRASWDMGYFWTVLKEFSHLRLGLAVMLWWASLISILALPGGASSRLAIFGGGILLPLAGLTWRRGNVRLGFYSFVIWNVSAFGLLIGFFRRRASSKEMLKSIVIAGDA
ncbi:glycosyl transferase [Bradyrhizobium sp. WBOS7]|uniref:Glycosyl transferase n=1 Tax=Bradyrhizobium betae TaxID=244734 RepID=A0AAE9NH23_9BRAD|nr:MULTISPECIES: glycosyltransferase family 2 protein [Bradyrhizobium]MDD1572975.1 glycosyl transferase [Bradyrhizobium sp. WBOS1]UUO38766.1 glycosyl transferase [Bradyrhizobium sp. WBOS01]MDD1529418.1 glycosyl transferase [Bradyrhizobium sp. WBOS2]MDD1579052.1 glycosyl transferase [Bradyrhizobium sp. WBOS7]MDD1601859.1 glycosyl transferase [Bradyrhizobium sp. WBOS16]